MRNRHTLAGLVLAGTVVAGGQAAAADPVAGAGSTFAGKMISQWITDTQPAGVQVRYDGTGSGDGRAKLIGGAVDFAASDVTAPAEEADQLKAKYGDFVYIPITGGGISVVYNVSDLAGLKLTGPTLAKIFSGAITNWNDPAIAADNGRAGPDLGITVVYRADKSGSTGVFTGYLDAAGGGHWPGGATEQFPPPKNSSGKDGGSAVVAEVEAVGGSIGYTDHGGAVAKQLAEVMVKNKAGEFRGPEAQATTATLEEATTNPDGSINVSYTPEGTEAYPITAVTYMLVPTEVPAAKAETFRTFLDHALGAGQDKAPDLGYAPFPPKLRQFAKSQAAKIAAR